MIALLKCERKKAKRKYVFLTALAMTVLAGIWAFYGDYSGDTGEFMLENGYKMFLYQLPLTNAIFFPLLCSVVASRLCDIEHKGKCFKQICTYAPAGKIYDAKLLYGLAIVLSAAALLWAATLISGKIIGFGEELPVRQYLLYLLFTLVPTAAIYIFQHSLSMLFKNQAVPFFAGVLGEFIGLFSMFLPGVPWLRKSVLWGYYGALQFVGLFGWTKETRYTQAYFEYMPIDWIAFAMLTAGTILLYLIGKNLFCRKEL